MLPPNSPAPYPESVLIPPGVGDRFDLGGFGIIWKIDGVHSAGRFSIVHHPLAPKALAAPMHRHHREDEYSYVLRGRMGAMLGDQAITAETGSWVFKPRNQWHTFWNAGEEPCETIELISPAGFENYFRELSAIWPARSPELLKKYELDMDPESVPKLCGRFGLVSSRPDANPQS